MADEEKEPSGQEIRSGGGGRGLLTSVMREFNNMKNDGKKSEDEDAVVNPFAHLEKSSVLQEASSTFNNPDMVKREASKCCLIITKLLYLLAQGEAFVGRDAENVFFAVTKLFSSDNMSLRRMTYLFIKEVAESTDPSNVIIVIQSLTKDMNSNVDLYRANAIRVLCKIIDASILSQIDRYIKQAVVDKNALVSASALICGNQMAKEPAKLDVVRRWANEVQESVNSKNDMVQFHALSLLYQIKRHDKLAIGRILTQYSKQMLNSPLAVCLIVRYTSELLADGSSGGSMNPASARAAYESLEWCLHHKSEMVILEAVRAICRLPDAASQDIVPAIVVLKLFLSSPKPTVRFAAVRVLNEVAMKHPNVVTLCNEHMELLITDNNKSIATLAITTLLKTGSEGGIEKLIKQISGFMADIADEFKIVVVRAVRALCIKYPAKHRVLLNFLSSVLRDEGGFDFKKVVVDTILQLVEQIPAAKEAGLFHLCEFIEDCEFTSLSAQILHVLGEQGPTTSHPAKYIRFVYNRIILENAHIRAAAVSALAKFGAQVESVTDSTIVLLERSLTDDDDEVRDRAVTCLHVLRSIKQGRAALKRVLIDPLPVGERALQRSLEIYKLHPGPGQLTFDSLPMVEDDAELPEEEPASGLDAAVAATSDEARATEAAAGPDAAPKKDAEKSYAEELYKIPEFAKLGPLVKSSKSVALTESETEYLVNCVKHVFQKHVVLDFAVTNTLNDQCLKKVKAVVEDQENGDWRHLLTKEAPELQYGVPGHCYVLLERPDDSFSAVFSVELKFNVLDCDPTTHEPYDPEDDGIEEDYPVDVLEITTTDFVAKVQLNNFLSQWEAVGKGGEVTGTFELPHKTLREAISAVVDFLGLKPCEGTEAVPHNALAHNLLLSGAFIGGTKVLARAVFRLTEGAASTDLKIAIRSDDAAVSQLVMDTIS